MHSADDHLSYLRLALIEAEKCVPMPTAFCVGCVLVFRRDNPSVSTVLSTGYSRELPGNTHAEANALAKVAALSPPELSRLRGLEDFGNSTLDDVMPFTDVYTTMEPCSIRTSGLPPCADALIAAKVRSCYIGVSEPDDFVNCEGAKKLKDAGISVIWLNGLEDECLRSARRGHT